jgi:ElaB/YqjD/DUF883 family membrane-anchored ribosome-binding protein
VVPTNVAFAYEKSMTVLDEAREENGEEFFNENTPGYAIRHEQPKHRLVIYLKASGKTNKEIAKSSGFSEEWVSQILRQPWARKQLLEELKTLGTDPVQGLLSSTAEDSVYTIIELRDKADDASVRLRAAQDLLDRYLGKATQRVESRNQIAFIEGDIEKVDSELAALELEIGRLQGLPVPLNP